MRSMVEILVVAPGKVNSFGLSGLSRAYPRILFRNPIRPRL